MQLSRKDIKELKARAHHLKPVVRIGQKGLTEALILETQAALESHELIKIHIADDDRVQRRAMAGQLAEATGASLVHGIGKTFTLFRPSSKND